MAQISKNRVLLLKKSCVKVRLRGFSYCHQKEIKCHNLSINMSYFLTKRNKMADLISIF